MSNPNLPAIRPQDRRSPSGVAVAPSVSSGSLPEDATTPADCASCGGLGLEPDWDDDGNECWLNCHRCFGSEVQS